MSDNKVIKGSETVADGTNYLHPSVRNQLSAAAAEIETRHRTKSGVTALYFALCAFVEDHIRECEKACDGVAITITLGDEGLYYGISEDVDGLLVVGKTIQEVMEKVPAAIQDLADAQQATLQNQTE